MVNHDSELMQRAEKKNLIILVVRMKSEKKARQLFDKRQLVETTLENGKIIFLKSLSRFSPLYRVFLPCSMRAACQHFTNSIISISVQFESVVKSNPCTFPFSIDRPISNMLHILNTRKTFPSTNERGQKKGQRKYEIYLP